MSMKVHLGDRSLRFPSAELSELEDHTQLYLDQNWSGLRQSLADVGYLRIRGLHCRDQVLKARTGSFTFHSNIT